MTDTRSVLLNENAAKLLGFNVINKAVNQTIISAGDTVKVLGIVANYHHQGLQKEIEPVLFRLEPNTRDAYSVKISTGNVQTTIGGIERLWNKYFPSIRSTIIFSMSFLISNTKPINNSGGVWTVCIPCHAHSLLWFIRLVSI